MCHVSRITKDKSEKEPCRIPEAFQHFTLHVTRDTLHDVGFTLLEVMLALVLFGVGTVSIIEVMQHAQAGMGDGESVLIATSLAQRRLEELRNTAYASLADEAKASVTSPSGYERFSRKVEVTTPYTNLKQLVVTVYWTAAGGETSLSLQAYRSNI